MEIESGSTLRINESQSAAARAEKEAADKITAARKRVEVAERQSQAELDQQKDSYNKRSESERSRSEIMLENTRAKGYASIRDAMRTQSKELHHVNLEGEKSTAETKQRFDEATSTIETRGNQRISETERKNTVLLEYTKKQNDDKIATLNANASGQMAELRFKENEAHETLSHQTTERQAALEDRTRLAVDQSEEKYGSIYQGQQKRQASELADLNWRASRQLEQIRGETSHKIDAYQSRQADPFYQLVNINGKMTEHENYFEIQASIPEHEQDKVSISVRGNEVVISGQRRSEEKLEVEPGHYQSTSAYQSFSESFPINWPVESRQMSREFKGNQLTVRLPKKSTYDSVLFKKKDPELTRLERPQFPKNLPGEKELAHLDTTTTSDGSDVPPSKRNVAGRVLGT